MTYHTHEMGHLRNVILDYLRKQGIIPPSAIQFDRLSRTRLHEFAISLSRNTSQRLLVKAKLALDVLLFIDDLEDEYRRSDVTELKMDAGKLGVKSILQEAKRECRLQQVELPDDLFTGLTPNTI